MFSRLASNEVSNRFRRMHGQLRFGWSGLAVPRDQLHELIASLPPCVIGMEARSGAHHWARLFQASGHTVRLIAPQVRHAVSNDRQARKNDAADAPNHLRAVQRPQMRVPIRTSNSLVTLDGASGATKTSWSSAPPRSTASEACSASSASCCRSGPRPMRRRACSAWRTCPATPAP